MGTIKDIAGQKFGRLTALRMARESSCRVAWVCKCECGTIKTIMSCHLVAGRTRSCGCLQRENRTRHGMYKTSIYAVWNNLKGRCERPSNPGFKNYGGRGIKICERWGTFGNFLEDMGECPDGMSIERIDNNGIYEPSNCKWATKAEQGRNKRTNKYISYNGKTKILTDWAKEYGLDRAVVNMRIMRGWSVRRALNTPVQHKRRRTA